MIELPSGPVVVEERLALLEDPDLAERLFRENPALFAAEPPRTQREVLAWTTRRLGTALLAVTAVISIVAGYAVNELTRKHDTVSPPAARPVAAMLPAHHARPAARHHASAPVQHHAASPAQHTSAPVVVYHRPVVHRRPVVAQPAVDREALALRAQEHAQAVQAAQLRAWAAEQHALATRAAARAARARARAATAAEPAPQPQQRGQAATSPQTASEQATRTDTATTTNSPLDTAPPGNAGTKPPPSNPGGRWSDRLPNPGTLGGVIGPVIGVPRDSCTPRGGRTGIVMGAIQQILSSQH